MSAWDGLQELLNVLANGTWRHTSDLWLQYLPINGKWSTSSKQQPPIYFENLRPRFLCDSFSDVGSHCFLTCSGVQKTRRVLQYLYLLQSHVSKLFLFFIVMYYAKI